VFKFVRKERVSDVALCRTASEVVAGVFGAGEADLGGGLFKKRVARAGSGKSGGYRTIIAYRRPNTQRVLFTYAFAKNAAAALTPQGQATLSRVADAFVVANDQQIATLLAGGDVREVDCDAQH